MVRVALLVGGVVLAGFPDVSPGTYTLQAALRPCDGNCGSLEPAVLACRHRVRVRAHERFEVVWSGPHGCHVLTG